MPTQKKKKKKSKTEDAGVDEDPEFHVGSLGRCPAKTVCTTMGDCILEEMDKYLPKSKSGTAPVPGGKRGSA